MKRSLKRIALALLAIVTPCLAWAATYAATAELVSAADDYTNVFLGTGGVTDATSTAAGVWVEKNDDTSWKDAELANNKAPMLTGSNEWAPALFDGNIIGTNIETTDNYKNISMSGVEGWNLRVGVANGVNLTIATLAKIQGNCYINVDETSKVTIQQWSAASSHNASPTFNVKAPNGLVFDLTTGNTKGYDISNTTTYNLDKNGSVSFQAITNGTHTIGSYTLDLGEGDYRTTATRTLVSFTRCTPTFNITATPTFSEEGITANRVNGVGYLTNFGDYYIEQTGTGVTVTYVKRTTEAPAVTYICRDAVTGTSYESVAEALEAGATTILLLADCAETLVLAPGVTIDTNGHSLTGSVTAEVSGETITAVDGKYVGYTMTWTPASADSTWDTTACWSHLKDSTLPTEGATIIVDASEATFDATLTISVALSKVTVKGNTTNTTTLALANDVAAPTAIAIEGKVALPVAAINSSTLNIAADATLIANVPAETEATLSKALTGNYGFAKNGTGTLTLNANVFPTNGTTVVAGILKFGSSYIGNGQNGTKDDVTVCKNAILDFNGKIDGYTRYVTLEEGATLKNSGSDIGSGKRQLAGVILTGDATIENSGNFGLIAGSWGATVLTLNGHTLTKKGTGAFWLCHTTVNNGTIKIEGGCIAFENDRTSTIGDIVLDVASDNMWRRTGGTVNYNGSITKQGAGSVTIDQVISGSGALTVEAGTLVLTATNNRTGNVTIASGATLDASAPNAVIFKPYKSQTSAKITVNGTLKVRGWDWEGYDASTDLSNATIHSSFGCHAHNKDIVVINGGTVVFTAATATVRPFTIGENGATIDVASTKLTINPNNTADIVGTGKLTKTGAGELVLNDTLPAVSGFDINAGKVTLSCNQTSVFNTTVATNATLGGTASLAGDLTLADGATIDATNGALTVSGAVTLPTEGTVTVTLPESAAAGTEVLACANAADLDLTKISAAPSGLKWVAEEGVIKLATAAAPANVCMDPNGTSYSTINACIEAMAELGATDFYIYIIADTAEEVTLPADSTLTFIATTGTFSGTVKDENGNTITAEGGIYDTHTYIASVTVTTTEGVEETDCETFVDVLEELNGVEEATVIILSATGLELTSTWVIDGKNITLDLGNTTVEAKFAYTAADPAAIWVKNGGKITLKNGTLKSAAEAIRIGVKGATDATTQAGTVIIENGANVNSTADTAIVVYGGSTLTSGGVISTSADGYAAIQGSGLETLPTTINITAGSVTATDVAIYHPQPGTLTIGTEGGAMYPFITGATGVEMRAGTLNMLSGTIMATAKEFSYAANGNGSTVVGAAIAVSQHTTGKDITVDITAGATNGVCSFALVNTTGNPSVNITADLASSVDPDTVQMLDPNYTLTSTTTGEAPNTITTYSVEARTTGAIVGNAWYETLAKAFEEAKAGDTIKLLADETGKGLKINKAITIDFNGHTYKVNHAVGSTGTETLGMQINAPTTLTSTAATKGKLTCLPCDLSYEDATPEAVADCGYYSEKPVRMLINNYADLTVTNVILDGSNLAPNKDNAAHYVLSNNSGNVVIDTGAEIKAKEGDFAFDAFKYASYDAPKVTVEAGATITGTVEVTGGTLDTAINLDNVIVSSGTITGEGEVTVDTTKSTYLVEVNGVYCDEVEIEAKDGESPEDAKARARAALELFTGIATGEVDGTTAKVAYDFGISDITVNRDTNGSLTGKVTITAKVQTDATTAAGYAEGVTVAICVDGTALENVPTTVANGVATFEGVNISDLQGKIKVKVSK